MELVVIFVTVSLNLVVAILNLVTAIINRKRKTPFPTRTEMESKD